MKSRIKNREPEKKELPFPKLMEGENTEGLVVLFTGMGTGSVVNVGGQNNYMFGYLSNSWTMSNFSDFDGKVILKN